MASHGQALAPVQQRQQQAAVPAPAAPAPQAQPKPTRASLSYEEISKLFSLPIAEAASILGVCTSVLKRICRTHGIVRWPYRKLVSGKAGDDVQNAEREKAKELLELSKIAKQKACSSGSSTTVQLPICSLRAWTLGAVDWGGYLTMATQFRPSLCGTPTSKACLIYCSTFRPSGAFQGVAKSQQGSSKAGQVLPPGKQNVPSGSPILVQASQTKGIPTYMDDFEYGFPSSVLSCENMKWWGTSSHRDSTPVKDENREDPESTHDASKGMTDDELDWGADEAEADSVVTTEPSAQLCSLRRQAVDNGRELLNFDTRRGLEFCRLNKRQKMVLAQVFGASLPEQWRSYLA